MHFIRIYYSITIVFPAPLAPYGNKSIILNYFS